MKKTVCTILLTLFVNMDSVSMIEIGDRRLLPFPHPSPFGVIPASENLSKRENGVSQSCVTFNIDIGDRRSLNYPSPFFVTHVNDGIPTSEDENEEDVNHVTFELGDHGETAFIPRALSPLPPVLPRSGSCCFGSSEKNENNDINPSIDLLQNEPLCSSPSKNKLPRSPSNYDIPSSYLFKETKYRLMKWKDFQEKVYTDRVQFFLSKPLSPEQQTPFRLTVLIMRHADDTNGIDKVHGAQEACETIRISGSERDYFQRFYKQHRTFNWTLYSPGEGRNKMTLEQLFPNCKHILDSDLKETYVPELRGISKKRVTSHADCVKMLKDPTYKTPLASGSVDDTAARILNKLSILGSGSKYKKIIFCSNTFVMNSIVSLFNKNKELVKFENLQYILIRIYGDYITAFTDQEGAVKVFSPQDLSSIYDMLYPSSVSY